MPKLAIDGTVCEDGRLVVATGDITTLSVDAIVNAANSSLMGGGGVDGAIHRAGGRRILEECRRVRETRYPEGLPAGSAVATTAGDLPAKSVIHTVGPVWHGGNAGEDTTLAAAYTSSLQLAAQQEMESIAFPAISTGIYGFPRERAAKVVYEAVTDFLRSNARPATVYLVFFSRTDTEVFLTSSQCH